MTPLVGFLAKRFETRTARCNSVILGAADYCATPKRNRRTHSQSKSQDRLKGKPPLRLNKSKGGETRGRRQMRAMRYSRVTRRSLLRGVWRSIHWPSTTCRSSSAGRLCICAISSNRNTSALRGRATVAGGCYPLCRTTRRCNHTCLNLFDTELLRRWHHQH